jgi:hypothetical protein
MSGARVRVASTGVRSRDIAASSHLPFAAHELEDPTAPADMWREFGI